MSNITVAQTVETRITKPVYLSGKGMVHVAVVGIAPTLCRSAKVTRLAKGGYSVRLLGNGARVECKGTDYIMVADAHGNVKVSYIHTLFS